MAEGRRYAKVCWSDREAELCDLLADDLSFEEIAVRMRVSVTAVRRQFYVIKDRFGAQGK